MSLPCALQSVYCHWRSGHRCLLHNGLERHELTTRRQVKYEDTCKGSTSLEKTWAEKSRQIVSYKRPQTWNWLKSWNCKAGIKQLLILKRLTQDILHDKLIFLPQFVKGSPDWLAIRKWICFDPTSAGVAVKVMTGIDGSVHRIDYRWSYCNTGWCHTVFCSFSLEATRPVTTSCRRVMCLVVKRHTKKEMKRKRR